MASWFLLGCGGAGLMAQTIATVAAEIGKPAHAVRELVDHSSGARWLVLRNTTQAAGPGRLVLVPAADLDEEGRSLRPDENLPVIRSGDRVILEEHTPVADTRLEATALDAAMTGSQLRVRLKIGGRVVRAVAVGEGRIIFAPPSAERAR